MTTPQEKFWQSAFGSEYTQRNFFLPADLDALYVKKYGISRTDMNKEFLSGLRIKSILEVGANMGAQLLVLQTMGYTDLHGIEINEDAIALSKKAAPGITMSRGSAFAIPATDASFDLVFTSGVLIHISPDTVKDAMREIHRTSRKYIWGFEYFSEASVTIPYRGHADRLWKANFSQIYLDLFPDLTLVREVRYKYLKENNEDAMFLLQKNEP